MFDFVYKNCVFGQRGMYLWTLRKLLRILSVAYEKEERLKWKKENLQTKSWFIVDAC